MRPKKLFFSEEDKKEIQRLRKKFSSIEIKFAVLNKIRGGCGEQCKVTCAHYCQSGCELTCGASCRTTCASRIAFEMALD